MNRIGKAPKNKRQKEEREKAYTRRPPFLAAPGLICRNPQVFDSPSLIPLA